MMQLASPAMNLLGIWNDSSYTKSGPCFGSFESSFWLLEPLYEDVGSWESHQDRRTIPRLYGNMKKNPPVSVRGSDGLVKV